MSPVNEFTIREAEPELDYSPVKTSPLVTRDIPLLTSLFTTLNTTGTGVSLVKTAVSVSLTQQQIIKFIANLIQTKNLTTLLEVADQSGLAIDLVVLLLTHYEVYPGLTQIVKLYKGLANLSSSSSSCSSPGLIGGLLDGVLGIIGLGGSSSSCTPTSSSLSSSSSSNTSPSSSSSSSGGLLGGILGALGLGGSSGNSGSSSTPTTGSGSGSGSATTSATAAATTTSASGGGGLLGGIFGGINSILGITSSSPAAAATTATTPAAAATTPAAGVTGATTPAAGVTGATTPAAAATGATTPTTRATGTTTRTAAAATTSATDPLSGLINGIGSGISGLLNGIFKREELEYLMADEKFADMVKRDDVDLDYLFELIASSEGSGLEKRDLLDTVYLQIIGLIGSGSNIEEIAESLEKSGLAINVIYNAFVDSGFYSFDVNLIRYLITNKYITLSSLWTAVVQSGIVFHVGADILSNSAYIKLVVNFIIAIFTGQAAVIPLLLALF